MRDISEGVDNPFPQERSRRKHMNKKTLVGLGAVLIACTLIASGAYIASFGVSETELNIQQAVIVNEQSGTTHGPFEGFGGCCFGVKDKVENRGCGSGILEFIDVVLPVEAAEEVTATHYVIPGWTTLRLEDKTGAPDWDIIENDIGVDLTFNPCCPRFNWTLEGKVAMSNTAYVLIYYMDLPDSWDDAPLMLASIMSGDDGEISGSGSTELNSYFPFDTDDNIALDADFSGYPDYYIHTRGAKIWLIPATDYDTSNGVLNTWNPDNYLFETDLVIYFDCDISPPVWNPVVLDSVLGCSLVEPFHYEIGPKEEICLITYWCVNWASLGGDFTVRTYINPQ